jgi:hypothetical protein
MSIALMERHGTAVPGAGAHAPTRARTELDQTTQLAARKLIAVVCHAARVPVIEVEAGYRGHKASSARREIAYRLHCEQRLSLRQVGEILGVGASGAHHLVNEFVHRRDMVSA